MGDYFRKLECDKKCNDSKLTRNIRQSQGTRMCIFIRVRQLAYIHDKLIVSREKIEDY